MKERRTRIIQVVAGLATCGLVGIAGFALPLRSSLAARGSQDAAQKKGQPLPEGAGPELAPPPLIANPPVEAVGLPTAAPIAQPPAVAPDPEKDADDFVARTLKEAHDRIAALDKEAEDLRIRLAKVEAASAKLKAAFGAVGEPNLAPKPPVEGAIEPPPTKEAAPDLEPPADEIQSRRKPKAIPRP